MGAVERDYGGFVGAESEGDGGGDGEMLTRDSRISVASRGKFWLRYYVATGLRQEMRSMTQGCEN
jgi:hypothetical protein